MASMHRLGRFPKKLRVWIRVVVEEHYDITWRHTIVGNVSRRTCYIHISLLRSDVAIVIVKCARMGGAYV